MPVIHPADAEAFETHGSRFLSYAAPSRGSGDQLCAWRLEVPPGLRGVAHRMTRDEVLLGLDGELRLTVDGEPAVLRAGDVAVVTAGSELRVDGGPAGGAAWVTTTPGLEAVLPDGSRLSPPWAR